jgi:hypothetical protein
MKEIGPDRLLIHIDDDLDHWVPTKDSRKNTSKVSYFNRPNTRWCAPDMVLLSNKRSLSTIC